MKRKIRMGMVGGSLDGFIGNVHRMAAHLDGQIALVCGAFSSQPERSLQTGTSLFLPDNRIYASFEEMIKKEKALPSTERMDFVSIVTPNYLHFAPAQMALENGFHVLCEKPLAFSLEEAKQLEALVHSSNQLFGLAHNYTGYPMVKEAKELVKSGKLGKIRKVITEYPQGWLSGNIEAKGQKQASWRTDPKQSGISCCIGDIGTHAENLTEYVTGLKIKEVSTDVSTFVEGRTLDDDASILVRLENGAKGVILASQIANGEENELKIRVYGENGSLEWLQSNPNTLIFKQQDAPSQIIRAGAGYAHLSAQARAHCRLPGGHPEGYIESLANLYRNFAFAIGDRIENKPQDALYDFPSITDGVRGMHFIQAAIESGRQNAQWITL